MPYQGLDPWGSLGDAEAAAVGALKVTEDRAATGGGPRCLAQWAPIYAEPTQLKSVDGCIMISLRHCEILRYLLDHKKKSKFRLS